MGVEIALENTVEAACKSDSILVRAVTGAGLGVYKGVTNGRGDERVFVWAGDARRESI